MFQVFRRHQKRWLTALTILAMIGFAFPIGSYFGGSGGGSRKGPEVVDTIFQHSVTTEDVYRARLERLVANAFFQAMISEVHPEYPARYLGEFFGSTRDEESIKDSIRLSYKADELGVRVSDDTVRTWISRMTDGKLTNAQFDRVIGMVGRVAPQSTGDISAESVFGILKNQLRIARAGELITGRISDGASPVTPYESWQYYRKLNDKLALEVIPVAVADFAAQIDDPGDATLRELYSKYIDQLPDPAASEPGFKEPRRVNLQFASVSLGDFTLAMKPEFEVSDEEVKEYYESHKELYRIRSGAPSAAPALVPEKPSSETEPSTDKKDEPKPTQELESKSDEEADKKPESKDQSREKPSEEKSEDQTGKDSTESGSNPDVGNGSATEPDDADQNESPFGQDTTTPQAKHENAGKGDEKTTTQEPAAESKTADKPEQDASKPEGEKGSEEKKEDTAQYKPVEEVTSEIRDLLVRDKARAELLKRLGQVDNAVNEFGMKVFIPAKDKFDQEKEGNPQLEFVPPQPPDFNKMVEELGLKLSESGLTSLETEPFRTSSLGQAIELETGLARGRSALEVMSSTEFYEPRQFQNFLNDEYFTAWKIDDQPEHKPDFQQIRERVLLAYRMIQGRGRAKERADKLAQSLRDLQGDMEKLREREAGFESITIPPTSLWSNAPVFSMQAMSRPARVPTNLPGVQLPSDELRNQVFELKEREVTVAPNQPEDIYYVVLLTKRESASREDFARSRQFIERQIQSEQAQQIPPSWITDLRREASGKKSPVPAGN